MNEYWNGIKISDIKKVASGCSGGYVNGERKEYFDIEMKDDNIHTLYYISKDGVRYGEQARLEIKKVYNEFNNIPEMYTLENEAHAKINGKTVKFGCRVIDNLDKCITFTKKEIDELEKQFKIRDEGWRHLLAINMLIIEGNKIVFPKKVPQTYLDQLEYMGYDISLLEFEKENKQNTKNL